MRNGFAVLTMLLATVSGNALAADAAAVPAVLKSPEIVQILAIDGDEQPGGIFGSRALKLPLTPGDHIVTVRYTQLFPLGSDDHDILKSPPVAFRFKAEAGQTYTFSASPPKRYEAAKLFAKNPDIRLEESGSGQSISGAVIKSLGQASLAESISRSFQSAEHVPSSTLDSLKDLWNRASAADRAAFASWMTTQAPGK